LVSVALWLFSLCLCGSVAIFSVPLWLCGCFLCASVALWLFSLCLCGISRRQRAANRERRHQAGLAGNIVKPIIPRTAAETHRELPHRHGDIEIVLVSVPLWLFLPALCLCGSVAVSPYLRLSVANSRRHLTEAGVGLTSASAPTLSLNYATRQ